MSDLDDLRLSPVTSIERPIDTPHWQIPGRICLDVDGKSLRWETGEGLPTAYRGAVDQGMLRRFARLSKATPEAIVAFANRWGILDLNSDGKPMNQGPWHDRRFDYGWGEMKLDGIPMAGVCVVDGFHRLYGLESLKAWRRWASEVDAMLRIAVALKDPYETTRHGAPEDWASLFEHWPVKQRPTIDGTPNGELAQGAQSRQLDRDLLSVRVNQWIHMSYIEIVTEWDDRLQKMRMLLVTNLFGAIALQLAAVISGTKAIAFCDKCGEFYSPERQPKEGQPHYCRSCRKEASRAYKARVRSQVPKQGK